LRSCSWPNRRRVDPTSVSRRIWAKNGNSSVVPRREPAGTIFISRGRRGFHRTPETMAACSLRRRGGTRGRRGRSFSSSSASPSRKILSSWWPTGHDPESMNSLTFAGLRTGATVRGIIMSASSPLRFHSSSGKLSRVTACSQQAALAASPQTVRRQYGKKHSLIPSGRSTPTVHVPPEVQPIIVVERYPCMKAIPQLQYLEHGLRNFKTRPQA